jgi:hypothetical protein
VNHCGLSYFDTEIVSIGLFLSELALKDVDEKVQFFSHLQNLSATVPPQFSKHKLIPELLKIMVGYSPFDVKNCDYCIRNSAELPLLLCRL